MNESARPTVLDAAGKPRLCEGVRLHDDHLSRRRVLLYPEGVLELNATAALLLTLCDGRRTVSEIVAELAAAFDTPLAVLRADVAACLEQLRQRQFVEL